MNNRSSLSPGVCPSFPGGDIVGALVVGVGVVGPPCPSSGTPGSPTGVVGA